MIGWERRRHQSHLENSLEGALLKEDVWWWQVLRGCKSVWVHPGRGTDLKRVELEGVEVDADQAGRTTQVVSDSGRIHWAGGRRFLRRTEEFSFGQTSWPASPQTADPMLKVWTNRNGRSALLLLLLLLLEVWRCKEPDDHPLSFFSFSFSVCSFILFVFLLLSNLLLTWSFQFYSDFCHLSSFVLCISVSVIYSLYLHFATF